MCGLSNAGQAPPPRLQRMTPPSRQDTRLDSRHTRRQTALSAQQHTRPGQTAATCAAALCASACSQHTTHNMQRSRSCCPEPTRYANTHAYTHTAVTSLRLTSRRSAQQSTWLHPPHPDSHRRNVEAICHVPASPLPGQVNSQVKSQTHSWAGFGVVSCSTPEPICRMRVNPQPWSNWLHRFQVRTIAHISTQHTHICSFSQGPFPAGFPNRQRQTR